MALTQRLELRQGQSLIMTPQLQQAIKLLQMSNLELQAYVEEELERNPLLERDDSADAAISETTDTAEGGSQPDDSDRLAQREANSEPDSAAAPVAEGRADSDWTSLRATASGEDASSFESVLTREPTLAEHVTGQLNLAIVDPAERLIGAYLIGMLDETGYLVGDLDSAAEALGIGVEQVAKVLAVLQTFDPAGVFARDLGECLALQLKERNRLDPAMAALLANLELVAKHDLERLRQICRVDADDLSDMLGELRQLNPKPGNAFGTLHVQPVVPDVLVRLGRDGAWVVELNSENLPRLLVNSQYHAVVARDAKREDDRLFLSDCLATANWLVKSLDQRARTILAVSREIVRQQDGFLVHGVRALRPLTLRTVAEAIGVHESTVSRVTANKSMTTPRGIFEMKYFFTTAIAAAEGGEGHSAEAVRHQIRGLIDAEAAEAVLSDDMIVERLRATGIDIARRTVAKYRESLGIASSVARRRAKRVAG